jgi:hypothetical protein
MDILLALQAFADSVSITHVLALNLIGWFCKGLFHHRGWENWTDIIPVILAVNGVIMAYITPIPYEGHFIIYGLANAGLAWLLHRIVKDVPRAVRNFKNGKERAGD